MKLWRMFLSLVLSVVLALVLMSCGGKKSDHPTGDHSEQEKSKKSDHPTEDHSDHEKSDHPK
jgi:hypothetical protein